MLLVGDLGGTKVRLAIWRDGELSRIRQWQVAELSGLEEAVALYLGSLPSPHPQRACIGVAGPLDGNRCEHTNAGWVVDGDTLAVSRGLESALLINDFHAAALGSLYLEEGDTVSLGGEIGAGPRVVLGAGTGLGVALVHERLVISGEGGHQDFAPRGELQREALAWLSVRNQERISTEEVCSGPGLMNLYAFLEARAAEHDRPPAPARTPSEVAEQAATCPLARKAVETFVDIYGSFAGDLALLALATGGVWLAGGIAPKLLPVMKARFRTAFMDKFPREHLLQTMAIRVIVHPQPGLLGAGAVLQKKLANPL